MMTQKKKKIVIQLPDRKEIPALSHFAHEMKAPYFVAQLLENIGIHEKEEARKFFVPALSQRLDSYLMEGMEESIPLFKKIRGSCEKVVVHGDYDVDGICGTGLLYSGLKAAGFNNLEWFLPNRFVEGYGLCKSTIESFHQRGVRWIITVDTGITAVEEIELARKLGIGVIIMDHHREGHELPKADLILNPNRHACDYPNQFLCGAGVAYKFLEAFLGETHPKVLELMDFLILGTLADMMPVIGENRIYLKLGLEALIRSRRPGIQALLSEAGLSRDIPRSQDILFRVTPLINAAGRMGDPKLALKLLLAENNKEAFQCIEQMKIANVSRREIEAKVYDEAVEQIEQNPHIKNRRVLVVWGKNWHPGVVGIVAARLVEKYFKPTAVLSVDDKGEGRASARSIEGFNWHTALSECSEYLPKWGGHYYAAGFSILEKDIEVLAETLDHVAQRIEFLPQVQKRICPNFAMPFKEVKAESMNWLQRFEPFGSGNEAPLFYAENVYIGEECRVVGGNHLKAKFIQDGIVLDAIAFQMGDWIQPLQEEPGPWVIAFNPVWNYFKNQKNLQIQVVGIQSQHEMEED